ncbi:nef protein [Anopheles sinensis]|uniref:Nef protein n=1 Tax=Anopheles sinensis TaxID=74873 RepID=A0A084VFW7_ANOSI|nr:nef protein [Anopheles sinensis]
MSQQRGGFTMVGRRRKSGSASLIHIRKLTPQLFTHFHFPSLDSNQSPGTPPISSGPVFLLLYTATQRNAAASESEGWKILHPPSQHQQTVRRDDLDEQARENGCHRHVKGSEREFFPCQQGGTKRENNHRNHHLTLKRHFPSGTGVLKSRNYSPAPKEMIFQQPQPSPRTSGFREKPSPELTIMMVPKEKLGSIILLKPYAKKTETERGAFPQATANAE